MKRNAYIYLLKKSIRSAKIKMFDDKYRGKVKGLENKHALTLP